jgi:SNF2 family DNA or RNA helicase
MFSLDQLLDKHFARARVHNGKENAEQINSTQFKLVGNAIVAALGGCQKMFPKKKKKHITSRGTNPFATTHDQQHMITLTLTLNKDDSISSKIAILQPNQLQPPPTPSFSSILSSDPFPFALLAIQAKSHRRLIFKPQHTTRQSLLHDRNTSILAQHALSLKEYKEAKAREHRQRINALKADNVEEYLQLVVDSKNTKIQMLMRQTDECLRKLAARLNCPIITTTKQDDNSSSNDFENNNENTPTPPINNNNNDKNSKFAAQIKASNSVWNQLSFQTFANIQGQPSTLVGGQLRQYQMQGLQWLAELRHKGLNGILADEMGLGKTIQVIALICHIKEESNSSDEHRHLPFLIAMPASVVPNWEKEFAHWAPGLKVVSYNGSQDNRQTVYEQYLSGGRKGKKSGTGIGVNSGRAADVCLTTYELLMSNKEGKRSPLSRMQWSYIIVDEAHRLKNHNCKLNREMRHHYTSQHRLLLTGTPLSNALEELWTLLNFLMPDLFNSTDDFQTWFGRSSYDDDGGGDQAGDDDAAMLSQEEALLVTKRLHQVLRPFMLRRMKESVAGELQKYEEHLIPCHPSPYQQALFSLLQYQLVGEKENSGHNGGGGLEQKKGKKRAAAAPSVIITGTRVNNIMMEMRNISNHPFLSKLHPQGAEHIHLPFSHPLPHDLRLCSKLELLDRLLIKLYAAKHKVLIFSTMTRALDIIEDHLAWRGFPCSRLDGKTPTHERGDIVNHFNNNDNNDGGDHTSFAFLLSFKAGGVGLNLQAADTVIMYDPEWNPQIDAQAIARCHRIGQDKKVLVLRLLTLGTVEERVFKVAGDKKGLAEASITAGFFDGATTAAVREKYLLNLIANQQQQGPGIGGGGGGGGGGKEGDPSSSSKKPPVSTSSSSSCPTSPSISLSNQDINKLLARTDAELSLFAAEDVKLECNELAAWKRAIMNNKKEGEREKQLQKEKESSSHNYYSRIATGEDIAGLVHQAQQMATPKPEENLEDLGRGKRARLGVGAMKEPTTALGGKGKKVVKAEKGEAGEVVKEVPEEEEEENSTAIGPENLETKEKEEPKVKEVMEDEPKNDAKCMEEESPKDLKKILSPCPPQQQQQHVKKSGRLALKSKNNENGSQGGNKKQKTV